MFITIITDCACENARARQVTRAASIFDCSVHLCAVERDIEAAGNLIDVLDAAEGKAGVVFVNVAPRNGKAKKWENGTPFGFFWYQKTLVISTIDESILFLANLLGIVKKVELVDIADVLSLVQDKTNLEKHFVNRVITTQFRSFEFVPRLADWIIKGYQIPTKKYHLLQNEILNHSIWHIDNFGNCKTTIVKQNTSSLSDIQLYNLPYYDHLKDVPNGVVAVVTGSSGLNEQRFLEIVMQGGNAAQELGLKVGDRVKITQ